MSIYKSLLMLILFIGGSGCSWAYCTGNNSTLSVDFGNVLVQRDIPAGTVIATKVISEPTWADCPSGTGQDYIDFLMTYGNLVSGSGQSDINSLYSTNLNGVAIKAHDSCGFFFSIPARAAGPYANGYVVGCPLSVDLVKTGSITSGVLTPSMIGQAKVRSNGSNVMIVNMGTNSSITVAACSVMTPTVNVSMGNYVTTDFPSAGHTTNAKDVPITLDCNSGARINAIVTADADTSTTQPGAIKLSSGGAMGVAVQLLDKNGIGVKLNQKFVVDTTTADGQYNFNWTARYLQTQSSVTTGDANATATLALTYE